MDLIINIHLDWLLLRNVDDVIVFKVQHFVDFLLVSVT